MKGFYKMSGTTMVLKFFSKTLKGDIYVLLGSQPSVRQVIRTKESHIFASIKEGFGLTLEGKVLSWFQVLVTGAYYIFKTLERDFIRAFIKTGIKHGVSPLITNFK